MVLLLYIMHFLVHPQCVLEKYPYIKFRKTFIFEDDHHHPFTFVPKTESSSPCNACGETFNSVALECTQCKFNIHCNRSCVKTITKKVTYK